MYEFEGVKLISSWK